MPQSQTLLIRCLFNLIVLSFLFLIISGNSYGQINSPAPQTAKSVNNASADQNLNQTESKIVIAGKFDAKGNSVETGNAAVANRLNALEDAMRAQNARIEKMNQIIVEQNQTIKELSEKLNGQSVRPETVSNPKTSNTDSSNSTDSPSTGNSQTQTLEGRVKKVEDQLLRIGAVRFSGDFRLRADGVFRRSEPNPPTGFQTLPLLQNIRPSYRLRLNMDTDISKTLSFHAQLATGAVNDPLTNEQEFTSTVARQPFFINEAWVDYHPNKSVQLQGGKLQEVFADNSRFLFDDDVRFNGFNEKYTLNLKNKPVGLTSIEFRAGQYIFSNPNVATVTAGSPLAQEGARIGSIGRTSDLFHQGIIANQQINKKFNQQFGADLQIYRNPNELQLASTANGAVLIVYPGLGLTLSAPLTGTGNATTTAGGATYTAPNFRIARLTYRLNYAGFKFDNHDYPVTINLQAARNIGISLRERDAFLATLQIGKITRRNDLAFTYIYGMKGANSIISQLTDNNLGTGSGVNLRTNHFRFDYGLSKRVVFQSLFFTQKEIQNSGDFPNFFVPLNAFTPRLYRFQEQMVFMF